MPIASRVKALRIVSRSSFHWPERPDRFSRAALATLLGGTGPAGALAIGAARYPHAPALVDECGSLTFRELQRRSGVLAAQLRRTGAGPGVTVGVIGRNHRTFVEAVVAASTTGADVVLLNTGFAAPELASVVTAEGVRILLHDDEFAEAAAGCNVDTALGGEAMTRLAGEGSGPLRPARPAGRLVVLTSGTTGRAKGAARSHAGAVDTAAAVLERIPLRVRDTQVVAAPLFHAWGLLHLFLGLSRSATAVLHTRFDPAATLDAAVGHRARVLIVVPAMLKRVLELGPERLARADLSALAVIASSGSALGAPLASEVLRRLGPVLYNVYGSTEVALATIATPGDLLRAPGTAGRVAFGSRVEVLDQDGEPVPAGGTGRVFVGSALPFEGYTGGGDKARVGPLMATGDVGHFDRAGRLFVDGRDDDMIVSGGENVFPGEVEDVLAAHPAIADVAVIGVPDDDFGQALAAFVVRRPGADDLTAEAVRDHVRATLARYKVPRRVEFVAELPRTTTGKVLKRRLVTP